MSDFIDSVRAQLISLYDNGYRNIVNPYHYQNILPNTLINIAESFAARVKPAISIAEDTSFGLGTNTGMEWLKISNTEVAPIDNDDNSITEKEKEDLFSFTIEKEYLDYYTDVIIENYQLGNRELVNGPFEITDNNSYNNLNSYSTYLNPQFDALKIFPQYEIVWNNFLQKFVLIWYTPVNMEGVILPYEEIKNYLNNFSNEYNYIYSDKKEKNIILRVDTELGLTLNEIINYSRYLRKEITYDEVNNKIKKISARAQEWIQDLTRKLIAYYNNKDYFLQNKSEFARRYFFIDENINLFEYIYNSYFGFKVNRSYYDDITYGLGQTLETWRENTAYKQGQYVTKEVQVKSKQDDLLIYRKVIYRCLLDIEGMESFQETMEITDEDNNKIERVVWERVTGQLADEEDFIQYQYFDDNNEVFNPEEYYRFVFPALEKIKDPIILPNGLEEEGTFIGNFIIPVVDCHIIYTSIIDGKIKYNTDTYFSNSKVICYIKKPEDISELFFTTIVNFNFRRSNIKIVNNAFRDREDLIKVVLGSNIMRLGDEVFYNCRNLKHCVLSDSLKSLGKSCFASCRSLIRASLPSRINILSGTYSGCSSLKTVVLSKQTVELGESTFDGCENLLAIYNTENVRKLGMRCFCNCRKLRTFTINERISELPKETFHNCESLVIVNNSRGISLIGEACFENCKQLTEPISFEHLKKLYPRTYKGCSNLRKIVFNFDNFEEDDREIPEGYCQNCLNLLEVQWAELAEDEEYETLEEKEDDVGPLKILKESFRNCGSLVKIRIPETVERVGIYAFADCLNLREMSIPFLFKHQSGYNWLETIELYGNRENKDNWVNKVLTKIIVRN